MRWRYLGACTLCACLTLAGGHAALAAGGDEGKLAFDTLDGWRIRPFPAVQLARLGVTRTTSSTGQHPDFTLDVLQGVGLGISFNPPWNHLRSNVYDAQGAVREEQWLGFSLFGIIKGGTTSSGKSLLEGAEVGFGASLDFLQVLSLGAGVDLYRGISANNQLFHTGLLPAAYGAGHFTREDVFVSISVNLSTTLFGGGSSSSTGATTP